MTQVTKSVSKLDENKFNVILDRIVSLEETGVVFPKNYSPENAARGAWLILQEAKDRNGKPVLESCTNASIANSLLKMVTLGLNPIKKQCYFIAYGDKLECMPSYQGAIATARKFGLKSIPANIIYKGDDFHYEIEADGRIKITKHVQTIENLYKEILGAYAVANMEDGTSNATIMTFDDIKKSWNQGATNGNSPAHKNFPGEMSKKTVINRACKTIINSSDDAALFEEEPEISADEANLNHEIKTKANKTMIGFEEDVEVDEEKAKNAEAVEDKEPELVESMPGGFEESTNKGPGF